MGTPAWWSAAMPELVHRRDLMQSVEKWQTMYVRYKCQPEAQVTQVGWDLTMSQRFADQLALEEQQPYLSEESLLYNGLAPTNISLRIVEAPAEFAVPVKQDRRLTPNFKVRVEVAFKGRCSFPLTLKAYVISQQEKDSVPEWVPDDFLDPDLPQRKPITELKGTTVITHHFEGMAQGSPKAPAAQAGKQGGQQSLDSLLSSALSGDSSAAAQMLAKGVDPQLLASLGWSGSDMDSRVLEQVLQDAASRGGGVDPATAAALATAAQLGAGGGALDALASAIGAGAGAAEEQAESRLSHDYEFSSVELVKPTRMNKVYLVFACSILEQDLMFVVYNIPTVGICRAEQRAKACQKLGVNYAELGGTEAMFAAEGMVPLALAAPGRALGLANGPAAAAAALAAAQQQRKRGGAGAQPWGADPALLGAEALALGHRGFPGGHHHELLAGLSGSDANLAALAAGDMGMQVDGMAGGGLGGLDAAGYGSMAAAGLGLGLGGAAVARPTGPVELRSRAALRDLLLDEYEGTGLRRKLSPLDVQALECQAGFPVDCTGAGQDVTISQQQWDEFASQYRLVLKLLRQVSMVWDLDDPCVIAGFDMDRLGTVQALSLEPVGTFICRFSMSQPGSLVLSCRVDASHPNADGDGLLHALIKLEDLFARRVETWIRDFPGASHVLDVYRNKRVDKRKVFASAYTRLRAVDPLDAYDDILV